LSQQIRLPNEKRIFDLAYNLFQGKKNDINLEELIKKGIICINYAKKRENLMVNPSYQPEEEGLKLMLGYTEGKCIPKGMLLKSFKWSPKATVTHKDIECLDQWSEFLSSAYWGIFQKKPDLQFLQFCLKPLLISSQHDAEAMLEKLKGKHDWAKEYLKVGIIWESLTATLKSINT
jgi:hypothetical protein